MDGLNAIQTGTKHHHSKPSNMRTCSVESNKNDSRHPANRIRAANTGRESVAVRRVRLAAGTSKYDVETKSYKDDDDDDDDNDDSFKSQLIEDSFRERALEEKCGVFGVISNGDWPTSLDVAQIICLGLVGLQHRGQESAGIVTCKSKAEPFNVSRSEGLVSSAFNEMSMMSLKGNLGIGHTRYSTTGGSGCLQLAQPFVVHTKYGTIAVAHNGELVNSSNLRETLLSRGVGLTTGGDSELITQCLSQTPPEKFKHPKFRNQGKTATTTTNGGLPTKSNDDDSTTNGVYVWKTDLTVEENNITSRILHLMSLTPVSYSLIVMYNECLYATRDCFGNRPLTIGLLVPPPNAGDLGSIEFNVVEDCFVEGWCISSESCPFPSVHAKLKRDVEPGEIIKFERNKQPKTLAIMPRPELAKSPAFCIFEYVYFARPDSILERQMVYAVRKRCGERLADESPVVADGESKEGWIVAPVPESSIPAALGYSQRSQIPYVEVFCKNRYVGRTFIQPSTRLRRLGVAKKFGPLTGNFFGKSIILIDDSIVRGTTIGQLVRVLREAGAKEVHIRIASPPLHFPCYMGINIPTKEELIANHLSPEHLALTLRAGSLKYLSVEGLRESVQSGIIENLLADKLRRVSLPKLGTSSDLGLNQVAQQNKNPQQQQQELEQAGTGGGKSRSGSFSSNSAGSSSTQKLLLNHHHQQDSGTSNKQQALEPMSEEMELDLKVGHCDACLTGNYPVELEDSGF